MSNRLINLFNFRASQQKPVAMPNYLKFTAFVDDCTVSLNEVHPSSGNIQSLPTLDIEISADNGVTWTTYTVGNSITVLQGESVMMRGTNTSFSVDTDYYFKFVMTSSNTNAYIEADGDLTSLLNGVGGNVALPTYCFCWLFRACKLLTKAPNLPSLLSSHSCYRYMFYGCSNLSYIRVCLQNTSANSCLQGWVTNINSTGDLYCDESITLTTGNNGIPSGWTRYNLDGTIWRP